MRAIGIQIWEFLNNLQFYFTVLHTANNNKDVFRGHGHTKTRVKTTIVDVALPWKSSALITLNERDHCVLQKFTFEEFHDFFILQAWILKFSYIVSQNAYIVVNKQWKKKSETETFHFKVLTKKISSVVQNKFISFFHFQCMILW